MLLAVALLSTLAAYHHQAQAQNNVTCCAPDYTTKVFVSSPSGRGYFAEVFYNSATYDFLHVYLDNTTSYYDYGTGTLYQRNSTGHCTYTDFESSRDFKQCITEDMVFQGSVTLNETVYYKWMHTNPRHPYYNISLYWDENCVQYSYIGQNPRLEVETVVDADVSAIETFDTSSCVSNLS